MVTFQHVIQDDLGIHARPAGVICREAKNFESEITIIKGDKKANAGKLFALMGLSAKKGDTIHLEIEGSDEEKACEAFQKLLKEQL